MNVNSALTSGNLISSYQSEQTRATQGTPEQKNEIEALETQTQQVQENEKASRQTVLAKEPGKGQKLDIQA